MGVKRSIIEEGKRLIEQHGFYKFTMDQLAKNLKISKKTIYENFSSKKELISAVIDSIIHEDMKKLKEKINREQNAVEKLRALFALYNIRILKKEYLNDIKVISVALIKIKFVKDLLM
jgi:AcrR family transcriptional regulator